MNNYSFACLSEAWKYNYRCMFCHEIMPLRLLNNTQSPTSFSCEGDNMIVHIMRPVIGNLQINITNNEWQVQTPKDLDREALSSIINSKKLSLSRRCENCLNKAAICFAPLKLNAASLEVLELKYLCFNFALQEGKTISVLNDFAAQKTAITWLSTPSQEPYIASHGNIYMETPLLDFSSCYYNKDAISNKINMLRVMW